MEEGMKLQENSKIKLVKLKDKAVIPAVGQGTWMMGEDQSKRKEEIAAIQCGIELGMTLIDTAEMYGEGLSEQMVGEAIKPYSREKIFLVSKVYPHNAGRKRIFDACDNSLRRLKTDYLDLYLLHWVGAVPFQETVECMEELVYKGRIKRWGVSNLDTKELEELYSCEAGENCQVNQLLYHIGSRGIEYSLLPLMKKNGTALMAYCPLARGGVLRDNILKDPVLEKISREKGITTAQLVLAFTIQDGNTITIPKAASRKHVMENAKALEISLTQEEKRMIDERYPAPKHKEHLDII